MSKFRNIFLFLIKWLIRVAFFSFVAFLILVFLLYLAPVQQFLTNHIEKQITKKIKTTFEINALRLNFNGNLILKDIYIQDQAKDTLLYAGEISVDISMLKLLRKTVEINNIKIQKLRSSVFFDTDRKVSNFNFIIDQLSASEKRKADPVQKSRWKFTIGNLKCENLNLDLEIFQKMDLQLKMGDLEIMGILNDINNSIFDNDQIKVSDTFVNLLLFDVAHSDNKPASFERKNSLTSSFRRMILENIHFRISQNEKTAYTFEIPECLVSRGSFDLSAQKISSNELHLKDSKIDIENFNLPEVKEDLQISQDSFNFFLGNFPWNIATSKINLDNISIAYHNRAIPDSSHHLTTHHLDISELNLQIENVVLNNQMFNTRIKNFNFGEKKGFHLNEFYADISARKDLFEIVDFELLSDHSNLKGDLKINPSFLNDRSSTKVHSPVYLRLNKSFIGQQDLNFLSEDNPMKEFQVNKVNFYTSALGDSEEILIEKLSVSIDDSTYFISKGSLSNILNPERFVYDIVLDQFSITLSQLKKSIPQTDSFLHVIPAWMTAKGKIRGTLSGFQTNLDFHTPDGTIGFQASYEHDNLLKKDSLQAEFLTDRYNLRNFFSNDSIKSISVEGQVNMSAHKNRDIELLTDLTISSLLIADTEINDILLKGIYHSNQAELSMMCLDTILNMDLDVGLNIRDSLVNFLLSARIPNIDLKSLGLTSEPTNIRLDLNADVNILGKRKNGSFQVENLKITGDTIYQVNKILVDFLLDPDSIYVDLNSDNIATHFSSNIPIMELPPRLTQFLNQSFETEVEEDVLNNGTLRLDVNFKEPLYQISSIFPAIHKIYFDRISVEFDEENRYLFAGLNIPEFNYNTIHMDSLSADFLINREKFNYQIDIDQFRINALDISNFLLLGEKKDTILSNQIIKKDSIGNEQFLIGIDVLSSQENDLLFRLNPDNLILNSNSWNVLGASEIEINKEKTINGEIRIEREDQQLYVKIENDSLYSFDIQSFELSNFSEFFEYYNKNLSLQGIIDAESEFIITDNTPQFYANMKISTLIMNETNLGDLLIRIQNENTNAACIELTLEHQENKILVDGHYDPVSKTSPLDMDLSVNFTSLSAFETFANGKIYDVSGRITGDTKITGNFKDININGEMVFNQLEFFSETLNNKYIIEKETLSFNKKLIQLKNFTLRDSLNNEFSVNGKIDFNQYDDINFDLRLMADQFTIYNKPEQISQNFYGKMIISADTRISGPLNSPLLDVNLAIESGTDLTYVMPPKEINLVSYEEIVEFKSPYDVDTTIQIASESILPDSLLTQFGGFNLEANISINKGAKFKLVIDPNSGDYVTVNGSGDLNIISKESTEPLLSGVYTIQGGMYQVSFYGLVQKSFNIISGSSIIWTGDPDNAMLNITASHVLRTSSTGLVASETSGMSEEEMNQYRRTLPYEVNIMIGGTFRNPLLNFEIDLIDDNKAAYPLVVSKLNRINSEGFESQLTQQVFGLLTIGSFIPEQTFDSRGAGYGTALATTAAANSLNGILTGELNKLSGKYLKGVDIDFGMSSFSQMSSGSASTQTTMDVRFSKNLFDDRITIEAHTSFDIGGDRNLDPTAYNYSNFQSDFAIKYDLSQKGDYKLKVFNQSSYDIIYKDIRTTGFAIIFVKDFNKLSDIKKDKDNKDQKNNK